MGVCLRMYKLHFSVISTKKYLYPSLEFLSYPIFCNWIYSCLLHKGSTQKDAIINMYVIKILLDTIEKNLL